MKKRSALAVAAIVLLLAALVFGNPWGITRLRPQNRMFAAQGIQAEEEEGLLRVTVPLMVRNPFPWRISFAEVRFQSRGEDTMLLSDLSASEIPLTLEPWGRRALEVRYTFDTAGFERLYPREGKTAAEFLRDVNFIFLSDGVPTGEAYCFVSR